MRSTYTYAKLPLSAAAYKEIRQKLIDAGYDHALGRNGDIDMHGLGVCEEAADPYEALLGSNWQPSEITISEGTVASLGDVVRYAFNRGSFTIKQWNGLPCRVREVLLIEAVAAMREEDEGK